MKDFGKNYLEYSDSGVLVKYIGDNGIDIDDYIQSLLDKKDQEFQDKIEKLVNALQMKDVIKRVEVERDYEYEKWTKEIPALNFNKSWDVKIIPPFGGAIIRFIIEKGDKKISVYLECYNELGVMNKPYWEAYDFNDDPRRFLMNETTELLNYITNKINK
jgi:hypothetical protein